MAIQATITVSDVQRAARLIKELEYLRYLREAQDAIAAMGSTEQGMMAECKIPGWPGTLNFPPRLIASTIKLRIKEIDTELMSLGVVGG